MNRHILEKIEAHILKTLKESHENGDSEAKMQSLSQLIHLFPEN